MDLELQQAIAGDLPVGQDGPLPEIGGLQLKNPLFVDLVSSLVIRIQGHLQGGAFQGLLQPIACSGAQIEQEVLTGSVW